MFVGFVSLDDTLVFNVLTTNSSDVPTAAAALPTYRIYGPAGLQANGTGSLTNRDAGVVTGATNATPIVITSASHNLATGMRVTIATVGGNTSANGTFVITRVDANSFSLDSSVGNGAYTSGGTWTVTGLYAMSITPTAGNGYAAGLSYDILVIATVSGNVVSQAYHFGVI